MGLLLVEDSLFCFEIDTYDRFITRAREDTCEEVGGRLEKKIEFSKKFILENTHFYHR